MMREVVVCIPLYNAGSTISRTLDSLLAQDYPIRTIKIFDNVSTDESCQVVAEYSQTYSQIQLYKNETNIGAEGNFTKCLQASEGDYTAIVHSDDIYEKDFIAKAVEVMERQPECVATFCGAWEINQEEQIIGERFLPRELKNSTVTLLNRHDLLALVFKYSNFITCPSVVARSSVYANDIKEWRGDLYKTSADLDVWLRLSKIGKIAVIKKPLMKYRMTEASYSYRIAKKRLTKHDLFLVLDPLRTKGFDEDYYFLAIKDQALRILNLIRNKKLDEMFHPEFRFHPFTIFKKMWHSKWHLKMGIYIFGIYALASFRRAFLKGKPE